MIFLVAKNNNESEKKNSDGVVQIGFERNMFKMPELNQHIVNLAVDEDGKESICHVILDRLYE